MSISGNLLGFTLSVGLMTLTPGLATFLVIRMAASDGRRAGVGSALGVAAGLGVWGMAASLGLAAVLKASPVLFQLLKALGALYLAYLGGRLILFPRIVFGETEGLAVSRPKLSADFFGGFSRGFLVNMLNPEVGVFNMTFFPQFIPVGFRYPIPFCLGLTGIEAVLGAVWLCLLVFMTMPVRAVLTRPGAITILDRLTGCVFIYFAIRVFI